MNKKFNDGFIGGYALAKGVIGEKVKNFVSEIAMRENEDNIRKWDLCPMNNIDFDIIDNILYMAVSEYWGQSEGGRCIQIFDIENNSNIEVIYDDQPSYPPTSCIYNDEFCYRTNSLDLKSYKYNKETGEIITRTVKTSDEIPNNSHDYSLINIEDELFLYYFDNMDNILHMVNIETGQDFIISNFKVTGDNCKLIMYNLVYVNGKIYISFKEYKIVEYGTKDLNTQVYSFDFWKTDTNISATLIKTFNSKYSLSDNKEILNSKYVTFSLVHYDYINNNPISVNCVVDNINNTQGVKIFDLSFDNYYNELSSDFCNMATAGDPFPFYLYDDFVTYNNNMYVLDYSTSALHKITFKKY